MSGSPFSPCHKKKKAKKASKEDFTTFMDPSLEDNDDEGNCAAATVAILCIFLVCLYYKVLCIVIFQRVT